MGYICRVAHKDDRRKKVISLTQMGTQELEKISKKLQKRIEAFEQLLGPVDLEDLTSQLSHIHTLLHKHI